MAFIRDALIASKFGVTYVTDIYMFSLGIVMLLTTIGYGLTTTLIPIHTENIENKTQQEKNIFVSNILNTAGIVTILFIVVGIITAPYIIYIFAPGFRQNPEIFYISIFILRIMFISLFFVCIQSIVTGILTRQRNVCSSSHAFIPIYFVNN
jgi:putative peptidoglycan lipid II flippase